MAGSTRVAGQEKVLREFEKRYPGLIDSHYENLAPKQYRKRDDRVARILTELFFADLKGQRFTGNGLQAHRLWLTRQDGKTARLGRVPKELKALLQERAQGRVVLDPPQESQKALKSRQRGREAARKRGNKHAAKSELADRVVGAIEQGFDRIVEKMAGKLF